MCVWLRDEGWLEKERGVRQIRKSDHWENIQNIVMVFKSFGIHRRCYCPWEIILSLEKKYIWSADWETLLPIPLEHTPSTGAHQTLYLGVVSMEVLLFGAKKIGTIECLGKILEGIGVHGQCCVDKRCVKGKKRAVCGKHNRCCRKNDALWLSVCLCSQNLWWTFSWETSCFIKCNIFFLYSMAWHHCNLQHMKITLKW